MLQWMLPADLCGCVAQLVAPGACRGKRCAVAAAAAAAQKAAALAHGSALGEHQRYISGLFDAGSCLRSSALQPDRSEILMRWRGHDDPIQGVFERLTQRTHLPHWLTMREARRS